jgi:hypothetical protein
MPTTGLSAPRAADEHRHRQAEVAPAATAIALVPVEPAGGSEHDGGELLLAEEVALVNEMGGRREHSQVAVPVDGPVNLIKRIWR